jgi:hypothetical protein
MVIDSDNTNGYNITNFNFNALDKVIGDHQEKCDNEQLPKTYSIVNAQYITFSEGRNNSTSPATFFTRFAPNGHNTFNHNPDKLNFAFHGDMYITIAGDGIISPVPYKISDMVIGQGHKGAFNNWWFGGANCNYITGNTVRCKGQQLQQGGGAIYIYFQRGGSNNPVSDIYFKGIEIGPY